MVRLVRVDAASPDQAAIDEAARVLRAGGLVAFPTETVYGLGANALDVAAVRRVFSAKGRPAFNPLIVHAPDRNAAAALAAEWTQTAERLAQVFWPGPLTLVVRKVETIPDEVTAGLPTVGLRVPRHPVAQALLRSAGFPIAAPSANPFTGVSPTTGEHVERGLGGRVDLVLDAGPSPVGIESAVLDVSGEVPVLLRHGTIPNEELSAVAGDLAVFEGGIEGVPARSPGMLHRHYAPSARVRLFSPEQSQEVRRAATQARERGARIGALLMRDLGVPVDVPIAMPHDASAYAQRLYAALHELDRAGCDLILIEQVPDAPGWRAVRDRLQRASAVP